MGKEVIIRIIKLRDGSLHIVLPDGECFICTASLLRKALMLPTDLLNKGSYERVCTNLPCEPDTDVFADSNTVLKVYSDHTLECTDLSIFIHMFQAFENNTSSRAIVIPTIKRPPLQPLDLEAIRNRKVPSFNRPTYSQQAVAPQAASSKVAPKPSKPTNSPAPAPAPTPSPTEIPEHYITIAEQAKRFNITELTVKQWIKYGKVKNWIETESVLYVDSQEPRPDGRKGRKGKAINESGAKYHRLKSNSYEDLQTYLLGRNLFSPAICPYIYSYEEARYYERHSYREVLWDGRPALIIDINAEYFSPLYGKTNRELILEGNSPVIPGDDEHRFHLHHVGRRSDPHAPFAIIPETDHNSIELYNVLHCAPAPATELHGKDFEKEKQQFWKTYLAMLLKHGGYRQIPSLNRKRGKGRKEDKAL